jgi:hypothetical protein
MRCNRIAGRCVESAVMRHARTIRLAAAVLVLVAAASPVRAQSSGRLSLTSDLDTLQHILEVHSAYAPANGYDFRGHIDSLRSTFAAGTTVRDFALAIRDLVGRLQDAHSGVELPGGEDFDEDAAELPFPASVIDGHVVALAPDGQGYLSARHPRLAAINGIPLQRLLDVAGAEFRGHSPQRFLHRAVGRLESVEFVLAQLDAWRGVALDVRLTDGSVRDTTLQVSAGRQPFLPERTATGAELIIREYAYLRIPSMFANDAAGQDFGFEIVRAAMESQDFANSRGLIIDVRGNGGGARDLLHYLLPYFIDRPLVYNAAVPRGDTIGLAARHLYTPDDARRDAASRAAATAFADSFRPVWDPRTEFGQPLFVAVAPDATTPYEYRDRPVVLLMDVNSFSATDIFLAAFALLPNATLMGMPSGGGSGRSRTFTLPSTRVEVTLSTMASFQPDGRLFDGVGVLPDVRVEPALTDLLGFTDTLLRAALTRLLRSASR